MASTIALDRLLSRLEFTLTDPEASSIGTDPLANDAQRPEYSRLQKSQYERNRVGANIEHARALLIALEKQSAGVRVQSQRQQTQELLHHKRETIKRLTRRLREMNAKSQEADNDDEDDSDQDDEEEEDVLNTYAPARRDANSGLDSGEHPQPSDTGASRTEHEDPSSTNASQQSQSTLRSRRPPQASDNHTLASTSARETLFANKTSTTTPQTSALKQTEAHMSHNRSEQEALTNGLIGLARALKESSLNFGASLETEKDVVARAADGLDKNATGMAAAGEKMGMLRSMSEGQGWWGRIKLYGFIGGLWAACLVLFFVLPKLRL